KHSDGRDDKHDGGKKDKQGGGIGSSVILPVPGITSYNFWNATNGIPEPGTMFLFLSGLLGLGWLSMTRKRQTQGASV
ncbi:PEP-CTERM sorting domain-containing protein, partial [Candidatus Nitrotoga sp. M5]|uniref:PEP-CTERM sorting domain-containing protein n=1 Tax=Candidatus Nitrotoga sp. M5 TaxID=2890409 RepID=UPI001EF667E6